MFRKKWLRGFHRFKFVRSESNSSDVSSSDVSSCGANPSESSEAEGQARGRWRKLRRLLSLGLGLLLGLCLFGVAHRAIAVGQAARQPVDAVLVLGGSIKREMYAAQLALQNPDIPIVISSGSDEPCIWLIFRRNHAPMEQTWIEPCARSTLGNYRFSTPVLKQLNAHHIKLVTSGTHQTRALGLGRTILAGQGMWLSLDAVPEQGRPGNQESKLKTALDLVRGAGWTIVSQVYDPPCPQVHRLSDMDRASWDNRSYECEYQGGVEIPDKLEDLPMPAP